MLLIELFTDSHIHNITTCLRLRPERLIFVGHGEKMNDAMEDYRRVLRQRGLRTKVEPCDITGKDLGRICNDLKKYLKTQEECVIDLAGGDELALMAVGAAVESLDEACRKRIKVQRFTLPDQTVYDCMQDNRVVASKPATLSVEEMIALHGGSVCDATVELPRDFTARDLDKLWEVVAEDPREWNDALKKLGEFESRAESKMQVHLDLDKIGSSIRDFQEKVPVVRELLKTLLDCGVINLYRWDSVFAYSYINSTLRYCTLKAGNVLEIKTLLEAKGVLENGAPYFRDHRMSVNIDWDGKDQHGRRPDTRNEIDVLVMRGVTPLFISCKNGQIGEELYKLHTVAERFGGPFARKMLVATEIDSENNPADQAISQRAEDMGITLVENAAKLTREGWREKFKEAME